MQPVSESAQRRDPAWLGVWSIIIVVVTGATWLALIALVPLAPATIVATLVASTSGCALVAVWLAPRPLRSRAALTHALMGTVAALGPVSLVVFVRLAVRACIALNPFGLPWAEPWRDLIFWSSGLVWLGSIILIVVGFMVPRLRTTAAVMVVWSGFSILPAAVLLALAFAGDPAPGCSPI